MGRVVGCIMSTVACSLVALAASGAEEQGTRRERWLPMVSGALIVFEDRVDARIDSTIGFPDAGRIGTTVPRLQLGLDLMSPVLPRTPTGLRLVAFGGLQLSGPNEEDEAAGAGGFVDPRRARENIEAATAAGIRNGGRYATPETLGNQGSSATSRRESVGWYLGLGVAFEFPDRPDREPALRLRPFVAYVGEQVDFHGDSLIIEGQPMGVPPVGEYTYRYDSRSREKTFHYLGPGLDAELVVGTSESLTVSLFAKVSFLWNLGDSSFTFNDGAGLGTYHFEVDDMTIRPGGGMRFAWRKGL